jgi:hypothetical protein
MSEFWLVAANSILSGIKVVGSVQEEKFFRHRLTATCDRIQLNPVGELLATAVNVPESNLATFIAL